MGIADMASWIYQAESAVLRVKKMCMSDGGVESSATELAIVQTYCYEAGDAIAKIARDTVNAFAEGDEQRMMLMGIKRFTKVNPVNTKALRQKIALASIEKNRYSM
jgi:hypothetical protein